MQSADDHDLGDNHLLDGALDISVPEITGDWKGNVQYSGPDIDLPPETGARAQVY